MSSLLSAIRRLLALIALQSVIVSSHAGPTSPAVRLDHIPLAVRNLEQAVDDYRGLGFAIKPGRPHVDGLRNAHIKFANGAGIELITADQPRDELSARYIDFLRGGEGPAFLSLHVNNEAKTCDALGAKGIAHTCGAVGIDLTDPRLAWVFFVSDNRSPTDRPQHFAHGNGAFATREVWVALDDPVPLIRLLQALGARSHVETMRQPLVTKGLVFKLADRGRIVIVPSRLQVVPGHPLAAIGFATHSKIAEEPRWWPPTQTHGLWLGLQPEL